VYVFFLLVTFFFDMYMNFYWMHSHLWNSSVCWTCTQKVVFYVSQLQYFPYAFFILFQSVRPYFKIFDTLWIALFTDCGNRILVLVFYMWYLIFPAPFVEESVFALTYVFGTFVPKQSSYQMTVTVWVHFWVFTFICLYVYVSSSIMLSLLWSHINFSTCFSVSVKTTLEEFSMTTKEKKNTKWQ
jgi:hypothetical protein